MLAVFQVANKLILLNIDTKSIMESTGLSAEQIEALKKELEDKKG